MGFILAPALTTVRFMSAIKLNKPFHADVQIVGNERTPIVVIDEPIVTTDELIHFATRHAKFSSDGRFAYPGIRCDLPPAYGQALVPELVKLISQLYKPPPSHELHLIHQLFSLVTQEPGKLRPLQRVPHFDNHSPYYFATVHYLNSGNHAGTGIFRHRPTGYERITEDRYPSYVQAAESHIKKNGLPAEKYINASDDHFELIAKIEYKPNRLVMYPGNLLHSGLIQPDQDIDADPATGRLTANMFMYFAERPGQ